jgi:(4-(4-[2-(gamma-L-glutamylamino)ethyl]phenoxymethyl)furan-2-yl)methanamine synthase
MPRADDPTRRVLGWDVGGAHVKACLVEVGDGEHATVRDIAQWPCHSGQGLAQLDAVIAQARTRWPQAWDPSAGETQHVATMTGEMVDLFTSREDGVLRLTAHLTQAQALGPGLRLYTGDAGGAAARWVAPPQAAARWAAIASANWRASAELVAARHPDALLVDIGSTTTDLIVLRGGQIADALASDAQRLTRGTLVYQGVVRTPLCALAQRVPFRGELVNVMNEFFATSADVYRLTCELDPAHDQQPSADHAVKDAPATRQRLARMIGRDAHEAADEDWLALARFWRAAQRDQIAGQLARVLTASGLGADAPLIGAGCGDFLAEEIARDTGRAYRRFAGDVIALPPALATWAQVCAPAVAVALLAAAEG